MSLLAPNKRLGARCLFCSNHFGQLPRVQHQQRRTAASDYFKRQPPSQTTTTDNTTDNPVLEEYQRKHGTSGRKVQQQQQYSATPGDIASSSIFEDDRRAQKQQQAQRRADGAEDDATFVVGGYERDPNNMRRILDPDPDARERWQRKKVIQMVRKGGRLSKAELIKRTEREHLGKSHHMKTSVKKLGMLARQIAGKSVEDAITQMRFSKKKIAAEVLEHLEFVRDEATVARGMGLGLTKGANAKAADAEASSATSISKPFDIQLKDGKRHTITDTSEVYVDKAWVGRGKFGDTYDYRARGQINVMHPPHTSLTVVLKEEATRVREYQEREAKRLRKRTEKCWVPLPNRPIQGPQTGWYSW